MAQKKFVDGFVDGLKRLNVKKIAADISGAPKRYIAGYLTGFLLKTAVIAVAGYLGVPVTA